MQNEDKKEQAGGPREPGVSSLVLDLNFVPAWARKPPAKDPYGDFSGDTSERRDRKQGRFDRRSGGADRRNRREHRSPGDRQPQRAGQRRPDGRGSATHTADRQNRGPRRDGRPQDRGGRPPHRKPEPPLPVQVAFLPEQDRLATMASDIRAAKHAFPLPELAHMFLNKPEWHLVKIEANKKTGGVYVLEWYESKLSGHVFTSRGAAEQAVAREALDQLFAVETVEKEPPAGNFVYVARCRLSGVLLGPPNYHGYNEKLDELHRTRFPHIQIDAYRREIETIRDPALVEQWKTECRQDTVYRLKNDESEEPAEPMDLGAARAYVAEQVVPRNVKAVHRSVISGKNSRDLSDQRFIRVLRAAWQREQRFPVTLVRALKGAFRRMGLHLFETTDGSFFVTAVEPKPVNPSRVIEVIREILIWLKAHPGCRRTELLEGIRPGTSEHPEQMGEVLQPLTWLLEKGHVIEFHNGTLAVPKDTPT